ncbi:MAG: GlsB/YeaQ/YmgE family stress response membrane protein [Sphingomonadales bacterium]|nr:GlsB/YeaQ/YmgE family stress response membrane protein [Sphingomonadales bacterium]
MFFIVVLIVGCAMGWLASLVTQTEGPQDTVLNVIVGIAGAFVAGFLISPLIGGAPATGGTIDALSLISAFVGAIVVLGIIYLFRRRAMR